MPIKAEKEAEIKALIDDAIEDMLAMDDAVEAFSELEIELYIVTDYFSASLRRALLNNN